ncbi:hypothetical protein ACRAWF_24115 [Streptomyces sp. L7]
MIVDNKVIGIVSWGVAGCTAKGAYPVFTKVGSYAWAAQPRIDDTDLSFDGRADIVGRTPSGGLFEQDSKAACVGREAWRRRRSSVPASRAVMPGRREEGAGWRRCRREQPPASAPAALCQPCGCGRRELSTQKHALPGKEHTPWAREHTHRGSGTPRLQAGHKHTSTLLLPPEKKKNRKKH